MSSPPPVPSKAALTALRGLLVGTSCTLALVAEDRRRRINNALRVIENGEKIKSAKRYRSGGAAAAPSSVGGLPFDPSLFEAAKSRHVLQEHAMISPPQKARAAHPTQLLEDPSEQVRTKKGSQSLSQRRKAAAARDYKYRYRDSSNTDDEANKPPYDKTPSNIISPLTLPGKVAGSPLGSWRWVPSMPKIPFPTADEIVPTLQEACRTREWAYVTRGVKLVLDCFSSDQALDLQNKQVVEATALLCRTCQELGRIDDAAAVLLSVMTQVVLEPDDYYSYKPLNLIESLLASETDQKAYRARVCCANRIFRPPLTERAMSKDIQLAQAGKSLIFALAAVGEHKQVFNVFRCCMRYLDESLISSVFSSEFIVWLVRKLQNKCEYEAAIRVFLRFFNFSSPTRSSLSSARIFAVADPLIRSACRPYESTRAAAVLKLLLKLSIGTCQLYTTWVMKLLMADWGYHKDFSKSESLFQSLRGAANLEEAIQRSEGVYLTMIQLALNANEVERAARYIDLAAVHYPDIATDPRLLGYFAVHHAKNGEWDTVREMYQAMDRTRLIDDEACSKGFVPVLKVYADNHTAHETIKFARSYLDGFKVPHHRWTVSLVAKQYASIRDFSGLANWLEECIGAGVKADDTFSSTILDSLRRYGNVPFRHIRALYRKLRLANPAFVGRATEWVATIAAIEASKLDGRFARGRVLSLRRTTALFPTKYAESRQVVAAMKAALSDRQPCRAVSIYQRAVHLRMPFSRHAFRLAVDAEMRRTRGGVERRIDALLRHARQNGADMNEAANHVIALQLKEMASSNSRRLKDAEPEAVEAVRSTLAHFEKKGVIFADVTFNRAAQVCLAARQFEDAIQYAHKAAVAEKSEPCYNWENFRILFMSYVELVDVEGLHNSIAAALSSDYKESNLCMFLLEDSRRRVMTSSTTRLPVEQRMAARDVIEEGLWEVYRKRKALRDQTQEFQRKALAIMEQAALDVGRQSVDYRDVPWTSRKKIAEDAQKVEGQPFVNPFKPGPKDQDLDDAFSGISIKAIDTSSQVELVAAF
ncbi:hypothetical protein B0T25DRAFT_543294 [Lasiosphaeria hispida]|uniref:Pentatricopeptide repeat protein n=1 Tax=Lasiosphaeria hispida TaxID=260671 RepID=A0AAJ0HHU2_9PEZI|nr:hypothetical protein B0T25DRAFT_543294 [Lasiosphaeria hispida]